MFLDFGIKDIIDIFFVALMLFYIYRLMKESRSLNVFIGIMVFVLVWLFVSQVLEMRLLGSIMDKLVSVGVIGLIVLFKDEIRKFLYQLGERQRVRNILHLFFPKKEDDAEEDKETIMPIVWACMDMAKGMWGRSSSSNGPHHSMISCRQARTSMPTSTSCSSRISSSRTRRSTTAPW